MSIIKPNLWNSVVVGKWNPAILSPKGIAKEIFEKKEDTPLEVLVPLDGLGPTKVRIDGFVISADFDRLVIDTKKNDWDELEIVRLHCIKAMRALPKTPFSAAGFNIRYDLQEPDDTFFDLMDAPLDNNISIAGLKIIQREIRRSIEWEGGTININIAKSKGPEYSVALNFDKKSEDQDQLIKWLEKSTDDIKSITKTIICDVLKACDEGIL